MNKKKMTKKTEEEMNKQTLSDYYDKNGKKIGLGTWAKLFGDFYYKIIASDVVGDKYKVSTVWLGLDCSFLETECLIFETMVFGIGKNGKVDYSDLDMDRYSTLKQAKAGHQKMLKKWEKK